MNQNSSFPECPRCGNILNMETWTTTLDMETGAAALAANKTVSFPGDCSACEASLELFIKKDSVDDKIGVDVWVEDQRED